MALTINTKIINDADNYSLDAKNVKGTYVSVSTITERNNLPAATIMTGSLCYVAAEDKFYKYNGTIWEEALGGAVTDVKVDNVSVLDSEGVAQIDLTGKQNVIDSTHKLSSDLVDDTNHANRFVTAEEKTAIAGISEKEWAGNKTSTINSQSTTTEYTSAYGVYHYHDSTKEDISNKVTSISSSSTDTEYPSAKCVYDIVGNIEAALDAIRGA